MSRTEKLSHYAVVLIAVSAVVVSIWQVKIAQEHNKLSFRPYLDFFYGWEAEDTWLLTLSNEGVGPAIITDVTYQYQGKTYTDWDGVLDAAEMRGIRLSSYTFTGESPFRAEKKVDLLKLRLEETPENYRLGLIITINYESIYKEPFKLEIKL